MKGKNELGEREDALLDAAVRGALAAFSPENPLILPPHLYRAAKAKGYDLTNAIESKPLPENEIVLDFLTDFPPFFARKSHPCPGSRKRSAGLFIFSRRAHGP